MIVKQPNAKGVDIPIQAFQEALHRRLLANWPGVTTDDVVFYDRCYRNKQAGGGNRYVAEVYKGVGEYGDPYTDDTKAAVMFFGIGTSTDLGLRAQTEVHLIVFADLARLKPTRQNRADEEVRQDVLRAIGTGAHGFSVNGLQTGLENVLAEYAGTYREERLNQADAHPHHVFRIDFNLTYDALKNCS
jgi:hypothetical protein